MKMPSGTVFSYYEPCIFTQLMIKADDGGWGNDFLIDNLIGAVENDEAMAYYKGMIFRNILKKLKIKITQ